MVLPLLGTIGAGLGQLGSSIMQGATAVGQGLGAAGSAIAQNATPMNLATAAATNDPTSLLLGGADADASAPQVPSQSLGGKAWDIGKLLLAGYPQGGTFVSIVDDMIQSGRKSEAVEKNYDIARQVMTGKMTAADAFNKLDINGLPGNPIGVMTGLLELQNAPLKNKKLANEIENLPLDDLIKRLTVVEKKQGLERGEQQIAQNTVASPMIANVQAKLRATDGSPFQLDDAMAQDFQKMYETNQKFRTSPEIQRMAAASPALAEKLMQDPFDVTVSQFANKYGAMTAGDFGQKQAQDQKMKMREVGIQFNQDLNNMIMEQINNGYTGNVDKLRSDLRKKLLQDYKAKGLIGQTVGVQP